MMLPGLCTAGASRPMVLQVLPRDQGIISAWHICITLIYQLLSAGSKRGASPLWIQGKGVYKLYVSLYPHAVIYSLGQSLYVFTSP